MNEYSYQERHMGTDVSLSFVCAEAAMADAIAAKTFASIHNYELHFSRFLPDSELSRLNTQGSLVVSTEFMLVLEKSIKLHTLTTGTFNPLLQAQALGYTKTFTELANKNAELPPVIYDADIHKIKIDHTTNTVRLGKNQQLDFGGVLKGYLATRLANEIKKKNQAITGLIINIGGDLATRGYAELHEPFIFELYNPVTDEEIPTILTGVSLATSGTYARKWNTNIGQRHHIVDAASLHNPTQNLVSVSAIHHDGAVAEALTKLFLVQGVTQALTLMPPEKYNYQFFAVSSDGNISTNLI